VRTMAPVPLTAPAKFGDGVSASVVGIKAINAKARGIGEVSGPGLQITVQLRNGTAKALSLDTVVVNLADSTNAPGSPMSGPPAKPFTGSLAAGHDASGVYVFTVPQNRRSRITITMSYSGQSSDVVFVGSAP
jgi:hypothetical protein